MYSEAQANLWANELLDALSKDVGISQGTKNICEKLKKNQNPWQETLKAKWGGIIYPLYDESDIVKLNACWHKNIQQINVQRKNQREYYLAQNNQHAASQIADEQDLSMTSKTCIVRQEARVLGWDPTKNDYVLVAYPHTPDLEKLSEFVDQCVHSGATNIPKSVANLIEEGEKRGYSENAYSSLWLQFIKKYIKNSYQPALTYSRNLNELFSFLLSLVDTNSEITKIRCAISKITRKQEEPVSFAVLKLKSLTSSLLFMMDPTATVQNVSQRASRAAIDGLYSLITDEARLQLTSWKRRCNEMAKSCSLQDHLDAIANIEQVPACKPSRDFVVPQRLADSDVTINTFWTKHGLEKPALKPRSKSETSQSSGASTRESSWDSRGSSLGRRGSSLERKSREHTPNFNRGRSDHQREPRKEGSGRRYQREPRREESGRRYKREEETRGKKDRNKRDKEKGEREGRNRSSGRKGNQEDSRAKSSKYLRDSKNSQIMRSKSDNCKKCGSLSHFSRDCSRYPFFYDMACKHCDKKGITLYHPADLCRFQPSRYKTPPPRTSPISFAGNNSGLNNIFSPKNE